MENKKVESSKAPAVKPADEPKGPGTDVLTEQQSEVPEVGQSELAKAVRTQTTSVMNPVEYQQAKAVAKDMMKSGAISKSFENAYQVQMAIMAGREMGMTTNEALNDLYFVNGRLQIYGKATPAAIRRAGWTIKYEDEDDSCTATVTNRKDGEEITDTFTFDDAVKSGFVKDKYGNVKIGWKEGANRKRKLRYAVLSQIIHTYIPEVLGAVAGIGEYSEDYMSAEKLDKDYRAYREQKVKQEKLAKLKKAKTEDEPVEGEVVE